MTLRPRLPHLLAILSFCASAAISAQVQADNSNSNSNSSSNTKAGTKHKSSKSSKGSKTSKSKPRKQASDDEFVNFLQWKEVNAFIDELVARDGFERTSLEAVFRQTRYLDAAIKLIKPAAPGKTKNWQAYRARFVEPKRIAAGVEFWNEHALSLQRAEEQYGVPAEIIVGILGVETIYGRNTGNFRVIDSLTTLAFAYPQTANRDARMAFFRGELESALLFARDANIDPFSILGSYAGAIGWPQYAVDFDGTGKIDLRTSAIDAIGSVANFLKVHGWQRGEPLVFPATVSDPEQVSELLNQGLEAKFTPDQLKRQGVITPGAIPGSQLLGLIDLQNGDAPTEYWLATNNYFAITQYNRSYFYAMLVIDLGRAVRTAREQ